MCFICNDTGEILVIPNKFNKSSPITPCFPQSCPLCSNREKKPIVNRIEDIINYDTMNNKVIKYIKISKIDFDRLKTLVYLGYNPQRYYTYTFAGVSLVIDNTINECEVKYYE